MKSVFFTQRSTMSWTQAWKRAQETWQKARGACDCRIGGEGRGFGFIKQVYDMGVSKKNAIPKSSHFQ